MNTLDIKLNNDVVMPLVGLGVYRMDESQSSEKAIVKALELGYKSIDTASIYQNEVSVGKAIKQSGIKREEIFLTSKVWNEDLRNNNTLKAFDDTLKRLDTDYLDLYLVHWPVAGKYIEGYKALEEIYKSGRVKSIGVSNFHVHHLKDLFEHTSIIPVVNQIEIHPYFIQDELIQFCLAHDIIPEAWAPLGVANQGLLDEPVIKEIASVHKKTPVQVILRWHIQRKTIVIPKSTNPIHLKENLDVFDFDLALEEIVAISGLNKNERFGPDPDNFNF